MAAEKFQSTCCIDGFVIFLREEKIWFTLNPLISMYDMKRLHLIIYIALVAAFVFTAMPVSARTSVPTTSGATTRQVVTTRSSATPNEQLQGLIGRYFVLKLVPFDRNNNFVLDTVSILHEQLLGELDYLNDPTTPQRYISTNPQYYRLFVPLTYYRSAIGQSSVIEKLSDPIAQLGCPPKDNVTVTINDTLYTAPVKKLHLAGADADVQKQVDNALMSVYLSRPDMVVFTQDELDAIPEFSEDLKAEERTAQRMARNKMEQKLDLEPAPVIDEPAQVEIQKPNWWKLSGNGSLQLSQLYLSDNWYKGGESSNSMLATFQVSAIYNDQEKVQWESLLDAKLGLASTPSDTVHDYLTNTDQLRIYSKLGVQASKHWYYTISAEFKTQFVHGYKSNNPALISSFFAPADLTVAVGLDYKRKSENRFTFSLFLAPLNWTMRYVGDKNVDETTYGLNEGQKVKHNLGSQVQPTLQWQITKNITFDSRLDYLTSYNWVRVEWENTLNMTLNRYLSTKLYVHARYDDSAAPISGKSHFQLSELLSFGINYKW